MSETKKKAAKQRRELKKTVGGPPPADLTPLEESVIGIIGDTPIDGIPGGIDVGVETELGTAMYVCCNRRRQYLLVKTPVRMS